MALAVSAADPVQWAWLGVRIRDLSEQEMDEIATRHGIREGFGVVIVEVMEDTPAEKAGMQNGDLVVAFGAPRDGDAGPPAPDRAAGSRGRRPS